MLPTRLKLVPIFIRTQSPDRYPCQHNFIITRSLWGTVHARTNCYNRSLCSAPGTRCRRHRHESGKSAKLKSRRRQDSVMHGRPARKTVAQDVAGWGGLVLRCVPRTLLKLLLLGVQLRVQLACLGLQLTHEVLHPLTILPASERTTVLKLLQMQFYWIPYGIDNIGGLETRNYTPGMAWKPVSIPDSQRNSSECLQRRAMRMCCTPVGVQLVM